MPLPALGFGTFFGVSRGVAKNFFHISKSEKIEKGKNTVQMKPNWATKKTLMTFHEILVG